MSEMEKLADAAALTFQQVGRDLEALLDAYFPGRREAREAAARLGYQGARCGWYPEKPKRRRKGPTRL